MSHPSPTSPIQGSLGMAQGRLSVPADPEQPWGWSRRDRRETQLMTPASFASSISGGEQRSTRAATWLSLWIRDVWRVHETLHIIPGLWCSCTGAGLQLPGWFLAWPHCLQYPDLCAERRRAKQKPRASFLHHHRATLVPCSASAGFGGGQNTIEG